MQSHDTNTWKSLAYRMLLVSRLLIVATLTWDFVITAVFHSSMKSAVITILGIYALPIICVWMISIIGLWVLLVLAAYGSPLIEKKTAFAAHTCLGINLVIYGIFLIIGCFDPSISAPLILNYVTNMMWVTSLIYFRIKMADKNLS